MTRANAYHIRRARQADLSTLPDIERAANARFTDNGLAAQLSDFLTPIESLREGVNADRLWVAADELDQPVGFALASVVDNNAHLDELDVHPAHGRRGLGAALVEAVCDWARASGYRAITLTTLRHISWNAPWYQRLGFRVLEEDELCQALRDLLQEEIQRGLPADQRVAMRRELPVSRDTRNGRDQPMVTLSRASIWDKITWFDRSRPHDTAERPKHMPQFSDFIRLENTSAEPIVVGDTRITPQAQAFSLRFPCGGIVWNRPTAVLVERDDLTQRIPIVDVTRVAQIVLFGLVLSISVIITLLAARQRRIHHE